MSQGGSAASFERLAKFIQDLQELIALLLKVLARAKWGDLGFRTCLIAAMARTGSTTTPAMQVAAPVWTGSFLELASDRVIW